MSQLYPDYSETYNLMRGSVVRLTIGDYIYRMPGFLENVNITIDNSNTPWEILLQEPIFGETGGPDDDVRQLPHMVTVSCTFKPIMDILPRRQTALSPFVPLIVNTKDNTDNFATLGDRPVSGNVLQSKGDQAAATTEQTAVAPTATTQPQAVPADAAAKTETPAAKAAGNKNAAKSNSLAVKKPAEKTIKGGWLITGTGDSLAQPEKYNSLPGAGGTLYFEKT